METAPTPRQARQELAHRMMAEYSGVVPAGQVLAAVLRVDRLLGSHHAASFDRTALCEQLVRRRLSEYVVRPCQRPTAS